ncbi:MAG: VTT domain-containing protein [Legionella sp.]|nr:VTT domain-containing protein [Legionella sp.]
MQHLSIMIDHLLHLDTYLFSFVSTYGLLTYAALFAIIFCETGLVITPFLPGDSLLFASGSLSAQPDGVLNVLNLFLLLVIASILGNQINYWAGKYLGLQRFFSKNARFLKIKYLEDANDFYQRYGGKTIIIARFIPIIRTFVPFVAGVAYMSQSQFFFYNLISAILWIGSLLFLGYFIGALPMIKNNFTMVIYSILFLSILPSVVSFSCRKFKSANDLK